MSAVEGADTTAIRARLDEWMDPAAPWDEDATWREREAMADALRAVLDLAADHDLCPALADCARDPSSCNELDITNTIATALGVGTP